MNLAVITLNSGMGALRPLFERLGMECGPTTATFLDSKDDGRIWRAEYTGHELLRKRRQAMRLDRVHTDGVQQAAEGVTYGAGQF